MSSITKVQTLTPENIENMNIIRNVTLFMLNQENVFFGDVYPLKHTFSDGVYVREIFIPAGEFVIGMIHRHEHPNILIEGDVTVFTMDGEERLKAPMNMMSKAGTQRVLYTHTDTRWITIHLNPENKTNVEELRKDIIDTELMRELYGDYEAKIEGYKEKVKTIKKIDGGDSL